MQKTSIRFFEDIPVRAVWDDESSKWWFCAMDIAEAITKTTNPRVYWATVKRRNPELIAICKQLKLKARDGKFYNTDVVDESGLNTVIALIPSKNAAVFARWIKSMETSLDEKPMYSFSPKRLKALRRCPARALRTSSASMLR